MKLFTKTRCYILATLLLLAFTASAQTKSYKTIAQPTVVYTPKASKKNAFAFTCVINIKHDAFFGDANELIFYNDFKPGNYFYYSGKRYSMSQLSPELKDKLRISSLDVCYDIQSSSGIVSTKCHNNVGRSDFSGSPVWKDMFPGLSAEQAKALYKAGYKIVNVRIMRAGIDFPNGMYEWAKTETGTAIDPNEGGNGGGDIPPPYNQPINWTKVDYYRKGDSIYIRQANGSIEGYLICGGGRLPPSPAPQPTPSPSGTVGGSFLSPFISGASIVWGSVLSNSNYKVAMQNRKQFSELSAKDYTDFKSRTLQLMDRWDGDSDADNGVTSQGSARARIGPKYPHIPPPANSTITVRWTYPPDYTRLMLVPIYDGKYGYTYGVKKPNGTWDIMESNGFIFTCSDADYKSMLARQKALP
jgi:hypothetical protein